MSFYHYTKQNTLEQIIRNGYIRRSDAFLTKNEKPVVWLSSNPDWENTVGISCYSKIAGELSLTRLETGIVARGLARIEVTPESAPYDWDDFKRLSGIEPDFANMLADIALNQNANPNEWKVSFNEIKKRNWKSIEMWSWGQNIWVEKSIWTHEKDGLIHVDIPVWLFESGIVDMHEFCSYLKSTNRELT